MGVMVSATSLVSLYVGLELQSLAGYVLASYRRTDERSAEAGLKYFVLGALASGILLYGISLLYGFTGTTSFTGLAAAFGRGAPSLGLLFGLVFLLAGLAFKASVGAVPHVDAGRLRRRADAGHRLLRIGAEGRRRAACDARLRRGARPGDRRLAADRHLRCARFDLPRRSRGLSARPISSGCSLIRRSTMSASRWSALPPAGRAGASAVLFYMAVYVVMTLGAFLCVLWMRDAEGRPVETIESLSGLSQTRPGFAAAFAIFMFSLAGIPPLFGFWPKLLVFTAAVASGYVALAVAGILGTVIGAYYYLRIVKVMYMDEPAAPYAPRAPAGSGPADPSCRAHRVAAWLSADRPAERAHRPRRGIAVLSRIRIVERTGSTNADLIADPTASEGDWLVALEQESGKGRQGREWVSPPGNFYGSTLVELRAGDPPAADAVARRRPRAHRSDRRGGARPGADAQMAQRLAAARQEARRDPARAQRGARCGRLRGQSRVGARPARPANARRLSARITPAGVRAACSPAASRGCSRLWRDSEPLLLAQAWLARAHPIGTPLTVHASSDETVSGRFDGIEPDGALRLRPDDGRFEIVRAGDISLG